MNLLLLNVFNILLISSIGNAASTSAWTLRTGSIGYDTCGYGTQYIGLDVCLSCRTKGKCISSSYHEADSPSYCPDETPYCDYDNNNATVCVADPPDAGETGSCECSTEKLQCTDDPYQAQAYTDCRNEQVGVAHMLCSSNSISRGSLECDCGDVSYLGDNCIVTSSSYEFMDDFVCDRTYINPGGYGCKYFFDCYGEAGHPSFFPAMCFDDSCIDRNTCKCGAHPLLDCPQACPFKVTDPSRPDLFYACIPGDSSYVGRENECFNGGVFDNSKEGCNSTANCVCYDGCDMVENYSTVDNNDYYNCVDGKPSGSVMTCPGDDGSFSQEQCTCLGIPTSTSSTTSPTTTYPPTTTAQTCPSCGSIVDPDDPHCFFRCPGGSDTKSCCPGTEVYDVTYCACL